MFYTYEKMGAGKPLAILKGGGGHNKFWGILTQRRVPGVLTILEGGGGGGGGGGGRGAICFGPAIFPFCSPPSL